MKGDVHGPNCTSVAVVPTDHCAPVVLSCLFLSLSRERERERERERKPERDWKPRCARESLGVRPGKTPMSLVPTIVPRGSEREQDYLNLLKHVNAIEVVQAGSCHSMN